MIRVQDYDELLEVSHLLAHTPKPGVPGIAVVSHSGGISSLTADMCGQAGLDLPPLGDEARDGINGILKGFGWAANPADVTGFANSESFPQIMEHMIDDPRMGTLVVASAGADAQAQQVISQRDRTDKGVVFLWTGSRDAKAGLATAEERADPDLLHAGQAGPRPAEPPRVSHMARASPGRRLCHGPAAHGGAGCRPSPRLSAWGVRRSRSPRASSCWRPGAWRVRASTGQLPRRPPSRPRSSSGFRWRSRSTRRTSCTRPRPGSCG